MSNTTEHSEPREFPQRKYFAYPREEMRQTVVTSLDAFWNTGAATCEGQGTDTIGSENDIRISFRKMVT